MGGEFVPLGCHSSYSLLWGTASVEALCERAKEAGVSTLALTDRNGLYGVLPFWEAARSVGIKPILGAHLPGAPSPAFLLAADHRGYRRLARVVTGTTVRTLTLTLSLKGEGTRRGWGIPAFAGMTAGGERGCVGAGGLPPARE